MQVALEVHLGGVPLAADVSSRDLGGVAPYRRLHLRARRPLDALVNNAGVMWVGPFDEEPEAAARRMMEVNFFGVVRGTRLVLPAMRARRSGHVVTVASVASHIAPAGEATYAATKHAVLGWPRPCGRSCAAPASS